MSVYLEKEKLKEIFKKYGGSETNTGSIEGQIALFTYRVTELSKHLNENQKDHASRKALLQLVGKRKRLLSYLNKKDIKKYRELIDALGIRK